MPSTLSRIPLPEPPGPGTVILILAGDAPDLVKLDLFLEAVTKGHNPASVLADLRLAAITITTTRAPRGRGDRLYLTVELTEQAA